MSSLETVFRTGDSKRDNFLSRVFGIFSEEIVRYWCANPQSSYVDLGRPTLYTSEGKWHTLDFTLRDQETSKTYVAEMKCELAYDNYRYLRLTDVRQLEHHVGAAFQRFLQIARVGHGLTVKVGGKPMVADGAILVWGATTPEGALSATEATGIADVLSVENMIEDLHRWQDGAWRARTEQLRSWSNDLFDLVGT